MKTLLVSVFICLASLSLFPSCVNAAVNSPDQGIVLPCSIPEPILETIFQKAAKSLDTSVEYLWEKYDSNECSVEVVNHKTYRIALDGGVTIILIDSTL